MEPNYSVLEILQVKVHPQQISRLNLMVKYIIRSQEGTGLDNIQKEWSRFARQIGFILGMETIFATLDTGMTLGILP